MADQKPEPPLKKDPAIEDLLNKDGKMMRSPLLWFVLLAVPVLFAIYGAFQLDVAPVGPAEEAISYAPPGARPKQGELGWVAPDGTEITRRGDAPECDYEELVGKQADEALQADLKAKKKAFRILPPGSMMTMDFSAERVNFDVDADGKITRAWCG